MMSEINITSRCCFPVMETSLEPPCIGEVAAIARWNDGEEWPVCARHERAMRLTSAAVESRVTFESVTEAS